MRKAISRWKFAWVAVFLTALLAIAAPTTTTQIASVDPQRYLNDVKLLTEPKMEGRGDGTKGLVRAEHVLEARYKSLGLEPAGSHGYLQPFVVTTGAKLKGKNHFAVENGKTSTELKPEQDYVPFSFSRSGAETAPLVFVGFGITAPEFDYDDYAGLDVKGKIVAVIFGAPAAFPSEERAHFASGIEKSRLAAARGAVGYLALRTPETDALLPWNRSVIGAELPGFRWLDPNGVPNDSFKELRAGATLSNEGADRLFAGAAESWTAAQKDAQDGKLHGFDLPVKLRMHVVSKHREVNSPNVVAVLRGSDPALSGEYVIYSAHTDHLGIGRPLNGDGIYNGAVDDASGVSALIEMAKAFASLPKRPNRSTLFLAATAEEKGLLGADYFAHYPTVPASSLVADVNMDGASVFYTFKDIVPLGAEHTTMADTVNRAAAALQLQVSPDPMPEQVNFIRADHYPFVRQGIPAITIGEGLQAKDPHLDARKFVENWIATRYHAPSDDMNQPLDFDATVEFMQISFLIGYDLAEQKARPSWKSGDFFGALYAHK